MSIADNLQFLRKKTGLSQEELAEQLSVSRQAIGKWESGQSVPELDKLIQLSDYYQVPLDRLIRNRTDCGLELVQSESDSFQDSIVIPFLLRAKKATYAGHGQETVSCRKNSHDFEYQEPNLYYLDTYLGGETFYGEEAVWQSEQPVWSMNYSGRIIGDNFQGDFLKDALYAVPYEKPFRGPSLFQKGDYTYYCNTNGDIHWFQGYEEIMYEGNRIYECYFHGGTI